MIQPAVVAAVMAVIGGVVAISARDIRFVAVGLLLAFVAAPLASSPEPTALAISFRMVGALLAAYLLWASARAQSIASEGSGIGALAVLATAAAAFSVGWLVVPVKPMAGPVAAQAAGISLAALAVVPLAGRDVLRVGTGTAVLALGISLLLEAWVGPASSLQQIVLTALLVGVVGATSLLISPIEVPAPTREPAPSAPGRAEPSAAARTSSDEAGPRRDDLPAADSAPAPLAPAPDVTAESTRAWRLHPREPRR